MKKIIGIIVAAIVLVIGVYFMVDFYNIDESLYIDANSIGINNYSREDFYTEYKDLVIANENKDSNEGTGANGDSQTILGNSVINGNSDSSGGNVVSGQMNIPAIGEIIECTEINTKTKYQVIRKDPDIYSMEFTYSVAEKKFPTIFKRVKTFMQYASSNNVGVSDNLLTVDIDGNTCYVGAMVAGFCSPGDIIKCTLNNNSIFYMAIVDVKSLNDSSGGDRQIDSTYGHGYLTSDKKSVNMCICEFLDAGTTLAHSSATKYTNGSFLLNTYVVKAERIKHYDI